MVKQLISSHDTLKTMISFQINCKCGNQGFEQEPHLISRSINFSTSAIKDNQDAHSQAERKTAHLRSQLFWFPKKIHVDTSHPVRIKRQSSCHTSTPRKILNAEYHEVLGIIWFQSHIDIRRPSEASRDPSATASRQIFHDLLRPSSNQQQEKILVLWSIAKSRHAWSPASPMSSLRAQSRAQRNSSRYWSILN